MKKVILLLIQTLAMTRQRKNKLLKKKMLRKKLLKKLVMMKVRVNIVVEFLAPRTRISQFLNLFPFNIQLLSDWYSPLLLRLNRACFIH